MLPNFPQDKSRKKLSKCMTNFSKLPHRTCSSENRTMTFHSKSKPFKKSLQMPKTIPSKAWVPEHINKFTLKISSIIVRKKLISYDIIKLHRNQNKTSLSLYTIKIQNKLNLTIKGIWKNQKTVNKKVLKLNKKPPVTPQNQIETADFALTLKFLTSSQLPEWFQERILMVASKIL